MASHFSVKVTM